MNKQITIPDKLPFGLQMLSNALPPVGFYLAFKYRKISPNKARTALINALIGIPLGLIAWYFLR
ncbi:hypothetical protein [Algoriphagus litoralis]|uniref:hypothetical protein n=1 Tax=Algoriphagus litoralis TaxID=2202829 RepID=UPI000DB9E97A|nr:hypothetical protein [Algoriphagus litoralis]